MLSEKPWNRELLLLLLAGVLLSWCLGALVGIALQQFLPAEAVAQKTFYLFVVNTLTLDVAAVFLVHHFLKLHGIGWMEFLGLGQPSPTKAILFALLSGVLALPVILALNGWSAWLMTSFGSKPELEPAIKVLKTTVGLGQQIYFGLAAIVLAPVAEESLFRGILYPFIKQLGHPRLALWGTSVMFGAIHLSPVSFLPLTLFALVLVFVYEKTDKLIAPIATHAFFNALNFLIGIFEPEVNHVLQEAQRWFHR